MRIAVVSEFRPGYEVALEACYARAFKALGHEVNEIATLPDLRPWPGLAGRLMGGMAAKVHQARVRSEVLGARPDLVVLVKAVGVLDRTIAAWSAAGAVVANVFPDNPFEVMRLLPGGAALLHQFRSCRTVFVHDRFAVGQLRLLGVESRYLAFARDPGLHDRVSSRSGGESQPRIVFVGNPDQERIRYLRAVADLDLGLWGAWHWARLAPDDPLARCVRGGEILAYDMSDRLGRAELTVNILRRSQKTAHNMRTFEAPASGTCVLSERSNGVLEHFRDGQEVVTFSTPGELRAACLALLADTPRRRAVAEAGWMRVRDETYRARAAEVIEVAGG